MSIKDLSKSLVGDVRDIMQLSELKVTMQIVPGSEKKLMPLAKKAGVRFQKPKPGDDEAHAVGDKKSLRKFMMMRGMNSGDIEDSHPELKEAKKLDPVGQADADIDNDGDTDSSDEYLKKRRAAIGKAMKDEGNKFSMALKNAKDNDEKEFVVSGKKYTVKEVEDLEHDPKKKNIKEKDVKETTMMSGKPEKKSLAQVRRDMQKSVGDANQKLKDAEQRKKDRIKKMQDDKSGIKKEEIMNDLLPILEKYDIELISKVLDSVKKFESLDEASPLGSLGIRQDFKQDSNRDARMDQWKKKRDAMKPIDKMKEKLEFMRKQRQVHDDAASKYRDAAAEQRDKMDGKDEKTKERMQAYAYSQEEKADHQEEMGQELHFKIQDLKDDIANMRDEADKITKRK